MTTTKDLQLLHNPSALHIQSLQAPLIIGSLFKVLHNLFFADEVAIAIQPLLIDF